MLERIANKKGVDAQMTLRDKLKAYASDVLTMHCNECDEKKNFFDFIWLSAGRCSHTWGINMASNLKVTNVSLSATITALGLCSRVGELNSILNTLWIIPNFLL